MTRALPDIRAVRLAAVLFPFALVAGPARFARTGDFAGNVEVQVHAADAWQPAVRNSPLVESSWVRTGDSSRIELELDEGSALRLASGTLAELSDYSRLSTGQRITVISIDHGLAYFTGDPGRHDVLTLAVPGAQVTLRQGSRVRLEASGEESQIAVVEGLVRFSTSKAEMDLREGQIARVASNSSGRFTLDREIPPLASDSWSEDRDKSLAHPASLRYAPHVSYGVMDLDRNGVWVQTGDYGPVWKPKVAPEWVPFRDGRWQWYDELGYTWIANESWGWLPFHYGRWLQDANLAWIWSPGVSGIFKPGEVYWMRGNNLAGWGPLALGENWTPTGAPRLYAAANTTFAKFLPGLREIDPATLAIAPKNALAVAAFTLALPSPPLVAARLDAVRPALRAGSTRIEPFVPGESYEAPSQQPRREEPVRASYQPPSAPPAPERNPETPVYVVESESEVFYPVPVYTGIVIINPPEKRPGKKSHGGKNDAVVVGATGNPGRREPDHRPESFHQDR